MAKRAERSEEQGPRLSVLCQVPSVVLWVIGVTFLFNFLYGPVDVGMPLLARLTLAAGPMLYGELFVVFGVGSLIGGLAVGGLRRESVVHWVTVLSVVGWGAALLLLAVTRRSRSLPWAWAPCVRPFTAASVSAIQSATPPAEQGPVIPLWAAVALGALPLETAAGGPGRGARDAMDVRYLCRDHDRDGDGHRRAVGPAGANGVR